MMKYTPEARSTSAPTSSAPSAAKPTAAPRLVQNPAAWYCGAASMSAYAATP
jgi:hypothetical protein